MLINDLSYRAKKNYEKIVKSIKKQKDKKENI
jgi:hypothetical protein